LTDKPAKASEISAEMLQALSFELIARLVELWRKLDVSNSQGKGRKFNWGSQLHRMIIDAMRFHPDIVELSKLHEFEREVTAEYEAHLARKTGINPGETQRDAKHRASTPKQPIPS
jgi:hypothetical protein